MDAVAEIQTLGYIDHEVTELQDLGITVKFQSTDGSIRMDEGTFNTFEKIINFIQRETVSISILLGDHLPDQSENSLTIELPDYKMYSDLTDGMKSIEKIFQLALPDKAKDQILIQNFDSGSLWLEITLASSATLAFVGGMVKIVSTVFIKIQQSKIAVQQVEEVVSDSKQRTIIKEALTSKLVKDLEEDSQSFLLSQGEENPSPERVTEVAKAFEMLGTLMDQGANFTPAYTALDSVKESFPAQEYMKSLPTKAKQLAASKQILLNEQSEDDNNIPVETDQNPTED